MIVDSRQNTGPQNQNTSLRSYTHWQNCIMLHTYSECHKWHCEQQKTTERNRIIDVTQRTTLSPGYNSSREYQFSFCPYKGGEKQWRDGLQKKWLICSRTHTVSRFGNTQTRETSWAENMALAHNHQDMVEPHFTKPTFAPSLFFMRHIPRASLIHRNGLHT